MIVVIDTQYMENYGAHDWDGQGPCPQRWKFKGGSAYKIINVPVGTELQDVVELVSPEIETDNDYSREYILGVRCEADDYLSEFELSQLDYEGEITYPEPTLDYQALQSRFTDPREYAEASADADAIYYGA